MKILIIGATGFIGGRLAEILSLNSDVQIRALVRNFTTASRLACLNVEMIHGDVTILEDVAEAAKGCDIIFNCAYGKGNRKVQYQVNVGGVRNIMEAASLQGIRRVVHTSTVSVYGPIIDGDVDESYPHRPKHKDNYGVTKLKGEREALRLGKEKGVEISVIQPTIVYGPWAPSWTITPLNQLKTGKVILPEGGLCNAVYIDDVVQGLILAAQKKASVGETFIISGEKPVSWKEFYSAYEQMLGVDAIVECKPSECWKMRSDLFSDIKLAYHQIMNIFRENPQILRRISQIPEARSVLSRFFPVFQRFPSSVQRAILSYLKKQFLSFPNKEKNGSHEYMYHLSRDEIRFYSSKATFKIDKAKQLLGYKPRYNLATGMKKTEVWAKWANFL